MWKTVAVLCAVLVLIVALAEAGPRKNKGGAAGTAECQYNRGDWQPCTNGQMSRTLTLKSGPPTCEATKTITKKCKAKAPKAGKQNCKYQKKGQWSTCTGGKMTRTVALKGSNPKCEATKVETKNCKIGS